MLTDRVTTLPVRLHAASNRAAGTGTPRPAAERSQFRPDIQGLRALAVAAVVVDHAGLGPFNGGFVGVDVFFVVSGFLITQLLLAEWERTGSISLTGFYGRRARRILPAATLVLIATVIGGLLLLNFVRAKALVTDAVWATFFAGNVHFGQQGTDYFAADTPPSALQHYWSLAVEEQFYLAWPVLLAVLLGAFKVLRGRSARRTVGSTSARTRVLVGLSLAIGTSFLLGTELTRDDPIGAYFATLARAWELGLGAAVAVLVLQLGQLPTAVRASMQWVGLAMIGYAVFSFDSTTPFPGTAALLPVVGTALVIGGGCGRRTVGIRGVLENRPTQVVGNWSYSLYLWHWPLLIIAAEYAGHSLAWQQNLLLVVVAIALSGLTYAYVENPFRHARRLSIRPVGSLLLYPIAVGLTLAVCFGASAEIRHEIAGRADVASVTTHNFGGDAGTTTFSADPQQALLQASALAARNHLPIPGRLDPGILALSDDKAEVGECDYDIASTRKLCERGAVGSASSIVLFGDSHARHWIPAVDEIGRQNGLSAYFLVKPACSAAQVRPPASAGFVTECLAWRAWAIDQIRRLEPSVLVIGGEVPDELRDDSGQRIADDTEVIAMFRSGLTETLRELSTAADRTFVIGDPPGLEKFPADCLAGRGNDLGDCASPPSERDDMEIAAARAAAARSGAIFVATKEWFCFRNICPAVVGSTITYLDRNHVTREYSRELAPALDSKLGL